MGEAKQNSELFSGADAGSVGTASPESRKRASRLFGNGRPPLANLRWSNAAFTSLFGLS